jgi:hypothetical protein
MIQSLRACAAEQNPQICKQDKRIYSEAKKTKVSASSPNSKINIDIKQVDGHRKSHHIQSL